MSRNAYVSVYLACHDHQVMYYLGSGWEEDLRLARTAREFEERYGKPEWGPSRSTLGRRLYYALRKHEGHMLELVNSADYYIERGMYFSPYDEDPDGLVSGPYRCVDLTVPEAQGNVDRSIRRWRLWDLLTGR